MQARLEYHMVFGGSRGNASAPEAAYDPDPLYVAVLDEVLDRLTEPNGVGYFHKDTVLKRVAKYPRDLIDFKWEHILTNLKLEQGMEPIPLTVKFFETHHMTVKKPVIDEITGEQVTRSDGTPKFKNEIKPFEAIYKRHQAVQLRAEQTGDWSEAIQLGTRAIASGKGQKTVGYANVCSENAVLVVARVQGKERNLNGRAKSFTDFHDEADKRSVLPGSGFKTLPVSSAEISLSDDEYQARKAAQKRDQLAPVDS